MAFGKDSSVYFVMDGNKLVDIVRTDDTSDKQPPDTIELEVMRIVKEHREQAEKIKKLVKEKELLKRTVAGLLIKSAKVNIISRDKLIEILEN